MRDDLLIVAWVLCTVAQMFSVAGYLFTDYRWSRRCMLWAFPLMALSALVALLSLRFPLKPGE